MEMLSAVISASSITKARNKTLHEIDELPLLQWNGDSRELMKRVIDAMSMFMVNLLTADSDEEVA